MEEVLLDKGIILRVLIINSSGSVPVPFSTSNSVLTVISEQVYVGRVDVR